MSKGLEALKEYRSQQQGVNVYADEYLDIIEKELKEGELAMTYVNAIFDILGDVRNGDLIIDIIAKQKKALEIIKNKKVQVAYLHSMWDDFETTFNNNDRDVRWLYNEGREENEQLTQEEYDLLKEVLL